LILGINYYSRSVVSAGEPFDVKSSQWPLTDMEWEIFPQGLTELLLRQHGSHLPVGRRFSDADKNADILGLSVYTRDLVSLPVRRGQGDELHWYAVRPAGSNWPV
jgi:hypothetical protein